ncbi:SusC/RagA family TonB-linked outer membrane protein [Echinicola pacifica]|uniref:SusC/RagA family TonB-linked outer membrane protein n=1 Tax=Echinicola pacifica TaxID=346377 RepID=A0A918UKK4_9BACT|nr:SusC/RagA family TonB-linked outer membrane protein [Echinicola pacifica]GGZ16593.1 SusC/RagA family TonB-linked outer membrane protein [Echinicola pacifica]
MKIKVKVNYIYSLALLTLLFISKDGYTAGLSKSVLQDSTIVEGKVENESVDVAFGTMRRPYVNGSVVTISGEELVKSRSSNIMIALQGRLPGLNIIQTGGEPSLETFSAQVRGQDSPNANTILFLVDGIERDPQGIDPHEIKRVTVLRDGAARAMYGMRAGAGAILIETKRGFNGKSKINISFDQAFQSPTRLPSLVSAYDYTRMYNQRVANDTLYADAQDIASGGNGLDQSGTQFYTPYEMERYRLADSTEFYPVRDMVGDFMKDYSLMSRLNINFRGGNDAMKFFTSVSYMNQSGLFENVPFDEYSYNSKSKSNRFNFRTNLDITLSPTTEVWVNVGGYLERNNSPYIGPGQGWDYAISKLYETPNNAYNDLTPDGEVLVKRDKIEFRNTQSIFGYLNRTGSQAETVTRLGNTFGIRQELNAIKGLSVSGQVSFDVLSRSSQQRSRSYESYEVTTFSDISGADSLGYALIPGTSNSTLSDSQTKYFYYMYNLRARVDYNRVFNQKHEVMATLLGEQNRAQKQILLPNNYLGFSGRFLYAYDSKYIAEANFAYQGSEQFFKDNRYGVFPSLGLGWVLSNEDFMKNSTVVNYMKLKATVGVTGNAAFNYDGNNQFLYITSWNPNGTEDQLGNENFQWETFTNYNIGVEANLLNSLYLSADFFYNDNSNLVVQNIDIIPNGMMGLGGASLPPANIGSSFNRGFELAAGYAKNLSKDWYINLRANMSYSKNEITDLAEVPYDDTFAYPYRSKGYPISQYWGYRSAGLFNSQSEIDNWADQSALGGVPIPGDIKFEDLNGDGLVDQKDIAPLASGSVPQTFFGLNIQTTYKWFDLNIFLNGATGRNVLLSGFGRWANRDNFTEYMQNAWTPEKAASGEDIVYPRLGNNTTNYRTTNYWIEDGSFLRLKNIELGYTMPTQVSDRLNAQSIRFYISGLNLLTFDNLPNQDFDPEVAAGSNINYPLIKSYNLGVSVQF